MKIVILCGGSGTRLWPISKKNSPKQFVKIFENKSLFELTIQRNAELTNEFYIVVNEEQLHYAKEQAEPFTDLNFQYIIEPVGRNTAPAILLSALLSEEKLKHDDLLIVPSDHYIEEIKSYHATIRSGLDYSYKNFLVTLGIHPTHPETGYGYIHHEGNDVLAFKEKPTMDLAIKYINTNNYLWNAGIFLFKANIFINELIKYRNDIYQKGIICFQNKKIAENEIRFSKELMELIPAESIDYAVMEKSELIKVEKAQFDWSDLGSFDSLIPYFKNKIENNISNCPVTQINSQNNFILTESKKRVALIDINDLIIVETKDEMLICPRGRGQLVKNLKLDS